MDNPALPPLMDTAIISDVRDVYPMYAAMRRSQPVARFELPLRPIYLVLRYDDVSAVLRDPETYSSSIMRAVMGPVMGRTILEMGGSEHTAFRNLVAHAFRPKALERYTSELIEPLAHQFIDAILRGGGRAELVSQFTTNFPLTIIARLLGVPIADFEQFQRWSLDLIGYKVTAPESGLAASRALKAYLAPIVAQRRAAPLQDLISELVTARVEGRGLTDEEVFGFLLLLFPAGAETTFRLIGNVLFALLSHSEQLDEVRADPAQLDWALEETLRWEPPLLGTARETTRAVSLRGVDIPERAMVSAMIGPANHDEEHYPEPDRFNLHRHATDHLAFGLGKHFCLGYHLAQLEVLTAVGALIRRLRNLRLDPAQECWIQGVSFRSPNRLPVLFDS